MEREKFYFIETFGCQMNIHDSEKIAGMLRDLGFKEAKEKSYADIIVFNTCCIRESAELKIMAKIGDVKALKRKNKNLILIICGCMSQQKGMPELLKKRFPYINLVIGTHNLDELENYIKEYNVKHKFQSIIWEQSGKVVENNMFYRTSGSNAWVNIMYGCNNFCTYCIVPYVRGRERSRKVEDIVNEIKEIVKEKKYKTITLLGQNVNSYGLDFKDGKTNFVYLLNQICNIKGNFKVKFMTSHPKDFSLELIDFIAKNEKMSKAIHLPVQSGSSKVLKDMNRHYDIDHYKNLVSTIYEKIPNVSLTTDIIVGFPNETEEDFLQTLDLLEFAKFSSIFGFVYSKRQGTPAAKFENQIPAKVKQQRITKLFEVQHKIAQRQLENMLDKVFDGVVEKNDKNQLIARLENGKTIILKNSNISLNSQCKVKVDEIQNNELMGQVI